MEYRIMTDGYKFRIQIKTWYNPFWRFYKRFHSDESGGEYIPIESSSKERVLDMYNELREVGKPPIWKECDRGEK